MKWPLKGWLISEQPAVDMRQSLASQPAKQPTLSQWRQCSSAMKTGCILSLGSQNVAVLLTDHAFCLPLWTVLWLSGALIQALVQPFPKAAALLSVTAPALTLSLCPKNASIHASLQPASIWSPKCQAFPTVASLWHSECWLGKPRTKRITHSLLAEI